MTPANAASEAGASSFFAHPSAVRNSDDERPFNVGIRADWIGKGKESISGNIKNQWSFGVFFGTDFSLFSRAD